jgi:outer membrane protein assembly factor BamD (BamD/ComL family)
MIRLIALFIIINLSFAFSQDKKKADEKPRVDKFLPKGNEAFKKKKYAEAPDYLDTVKKVSEKYKEKTRSQKI